MSDLKNDWVYGDTVMASDMNDIANAVNSKLDASALEGVALESSVQAINTKIGATDDTGATTTTGSVMGKLNNIQANMEDGWATFLAVNGNYSYQLPNTQRTVTVCNINGAGKLHTVLFKFLPSDRLESASNYVSFQLYIDNQLITTFNATAATSYAEQDLYYWLAPYQEYVTYSSLFTNAQEITSVYITNTSIHNSSGGSTRTSYRLYYTYTTNAIPFNSNVRVDCTFYPWSYSSRFPVSVESQLRYTM